MVSTERQEAKKNFSLKTWKRLAGFLAPYRFNMALVISTMIFTALLDIIIPLFQRYAIDNFIEAGTKANLAPYILLYVSVIAIQTLTVVIFSRQATQVEMKLGRDLKRASFVHLQELSFSYYNQNSVGYVLARVMSDTNRIAQTVAWGLVDLLWALAYVIGVFVAMFFLNVKLALLVGVVVPVIAILTVYFQRKLLRWNRKIRKINSQISSGYNEGITGAKTSKTLVIEDKSYGEFKEITSRMRSASIKNAKLGSLFISIVMFFSSLAIALVLTEGGQYVISDLMMLGTLSAFTSYAVGIFEPIQQIARVFADVISAQANIERVSALLDQKPDIVDTPEVEAKYGDMVHAKRENWELIRGDIEFKDVSFHYPDGEEYILEHFNLKIPAGTTVAIVGETGAGKSTLVNLACRFFEPTDGQILIDGKDYRERSQLWLHSNIGYVLQNPHLFSGSVRENIRYGRLDATDEEIEAAAKAVSADLVVEKLENGYDSDVGEGGDRLSTGEKQLISFARAVLADPRIFVLDEATSSIDTKTEKLIQDAIAHLLKDRTSFLIAHRLSTIRQADLILVVRDGKIIEQGKHQELLEKKGYYYTLYSKQFEEEAAMQVLTGEE